MVENLSSMAILRANRAKGLFEWWNCIHPEDKRKQVNLAKFMGITPIVLNAKLNAKRTLTETDAKKIADYFGVRFEYVMGYDDARTESELFNALINKVQDRSQRRINSFVTLAEACGYEVIPAGTSCLVPDGKGGVKTEDYYYLRQGEIEQLLYSSQIIDFVEELSDFLSARLSRFVKGNGGSDNG